VYEHWVPAFGHLSDIKALVCRIDIQCNFLGFSSNSLVEIFCVIDGFMDNILHNLLLRVNYPSTVLNRCIMLYGTIKNSQLFCRYVGLICFDRKVGHMFVMLMDGVLLRIPTSK
jgi:hypothetical protein